ncbi:MAG: hypothetical protein U0X39_03385 [Bacteroidales bacterium]
METNSRKYYLTPTFGDSFGTGWNVMSDQFLRLLLVVIVLSIVDAPLKLVNFKFDPTDLNFHHFEIENFLKLATFGVFAAFMGLIGLLYYFLVAPVFRYGSKLMFVQAVRQERPDFDLLIKGFRENYLSIILANLLVTALITIGIFALIIPGIIVACRLVFTGFIVMDKKLDPVESLELSWKLTRGHGWTIFFMGLTSVFLFIFGLMMLIVGIFPVGVWVGSSFAALYESTLREHERLSGVNQAA